jgi:prepilin peptidase CpaA
MNAFLGDWRSASPASAQVWPGLRLALIGFAIAFAVNFVMYILHFRGAGDVKLMAAIGAMVGWEDWFAIFLFSAVIGGVISLILVVLKKRAMKTFFNVGFMLSEMKSGRAAYVSREELDVKSDKALRLPAGAVIAIGVVFFLAISAHYTG